MLLWTDYIETLHVAFGERPRPMEWIREAIREILRWTELSAMYEYVYGSRTYAEAGLAMGRFGWFRKRGASPTPSESSEEESDEED